MPIKFVSNSLVLCNGALKQISFKYRYIASKLDSYCPYKTLIPICSAISIIPKSIHKDWFIIIVNADIEQGKIGNLY